MKVRAKGETDTWVGFYNHLRRRGGDVFALEDPKHFSPKWMEQVDESSPETKPAHFNKFGKGQPRPSAPEGPAAISTVAKAGAGGSVI